MENIFITYKIKFPIFFLLLISFFVSCKTIGYKEAAKVTENIFLNPSESKSLLVLEYGLTLFKIDDEALGFGSHTINYILPGYHTFLVRYAMGNKMSDIAQVSYTLEAGKIYNLNYKISKDAIKSTYEKYDGIEFFIEEERIGAYLTFSEANPLYLKGNWRNISFYPHINIEITFKDNKQFTTTSFSDFFKPITTEGVYLFNESTIILYYAKRNNEDIYKTEIIEYELNDGILKIKPDNFKSPDPARLIKAEFEIIN